MTKFAERLKELREEKGLTHRQLSQELNGKISSAAISLWENKLRVPNIDALYLLANYFKVSTDYLLGMED